MKNPNISLMIKYYRKFNNLSIKAVVEAFKKSQYDISPKTIYGWESGQTQPDAASLLFLCKLYKINDLLTTFGYQQNNDLSFEPELILSDIEKSIILNYRKQKEMQPAILKILDLDSNS